MVVYSYDKISLTEIVYYAPKVTGKKIVGLSIGSDIYSYNGQSWSPNSGINLTDNNTIVNVMWEKLIKNPT